MSYPCANTIIMLIMSLANMASKRCEIKYVIMVIRLKRLFPVVCPPDEQKSSCSVRHMCHPAMLPHFTPTTPSPFPFTTVASLIYQDSLRIPSALPPLLNGNPQFSQERHFQYLPGAICNNAYLSLLLHIGFQSFLIIIHPFFILFYDLGPFLIFLHMHPGRPGPLHLLKAHRQQIFISFNIESSFRNTVLTINSAV
jgi:hypothetical protein